MYGNVQTLHRINTNLPFRKLAVNHHLLHHIIRMRPEFNKTHSWHNSKWVIVHILYKYMHFLKKITHNAQDKVLRNK
jgi:hypothetical protein